MKKNFDKKNKMKIEEKQKEIERFNRRITACKTCRLSLTRNNVLCGEGRADAQFLLVALSPGTEEDLHNKMFIGPSGRVLDNLFKLTGIVRQSFYMTNLVKCMLPKNRRPKMDEIKSCSYFLDKEIAIIRPRLIVTLGYYASRYILEKFHANPPPARNDFGDLYGNLIFSKNQKILPLPHPASLLYNPSFEYETIKKYEKLHSLLTEIESVLNSSCH
ncbi:MAG: uracil-DNA glycosylase [Desulfobacteraceae bacterium]|nr:uracil-DNA glycosylase [Desulfobacteraceae bacterium]MBC2755744.1 uracil-DNA glycosylase [Desulfobacteraceae bacterium]